MNNNKLMANESLLPRHIIINSVIPYLDLHTLIIFSGSSRTCQKLVYQETPQARWRRVDLSGSSITDDQLRVFLKNVNAKEHTLLLSLVGCRNVQGPGLEPLHGSKVLQDIDLRVRGSLPRQGETLHGPSGLMEDCVARILVSMLPLHCEQQDRGVVWSEEETNVALRRVAIRPLTLSSTTATTLGRFSRYSPTLSRFFRYYDSLKRVLPSDPSRKKSSNPCSLCSVQTTCIGEILRCSTCEQYYCKPCAIPKQCSECSKLKCQWCSNVVTCASCNKQSCASHGYEGCGGCEKVFCFDCHGELEFCVVCNEHYCTEECHQHAH